MVMTGQVVATVSEVGVTMTSRSVLPAVVTRAQAVIQDRKNIENTTSGSLSPACLVVESERAVESFRGDPAGSLRVTLGTLSSAAVPKWWVMDVVMEEDGNLATVAVMEEAAADMKNTRAAAEAAEEEAAMEAGLVEPHGARTIGLENREARTAGEAVESAEARREATRHRHPTATRDRDSARSARGIITTCDCRLSDPCIHPVHHTKERKRERDAGEQARSISSRFYSQSKTTGRYSQQLEFPINKSHIVYFIHIGRILLFFSSVFRDEEGIAMGVQGQRERNH